MAARIADRLRESELTLADASHGEVPADLPDDALQVLRHGMAEHCGVVRHGDGLSTLIDNIDGMIAANGPARALVAARLIVDAALAREESRGGHFRSDFPQTDTQAARTFTRLPVPPETALEPA